MELWDEGASYEGREDLENHSSYLGQGKDERGRVERREGKGWLILLLLCGLIIISVVRIKDHLVQISHKANID